MSNPSSSRITPVILCGGAGTRLWPVSRRARPKQLQALTGAETMLQLTAARCADPAMFAAPVVVAAAAQAEAIAAQLGAAQLGAERIGALILEPAARNTAPAIALAALHAGGDALLLILPSDHLIRDAGAFRAAVARGSAAARDGWIVTFGMTPDRPETGFGYIQRGAALAPAVFRADRFVEKPDLARAEAYLLDGSYDWNGGIFLCRADVMLAELAAHAPAVLMAARAALSAAGREGCRLLPDAVAFAAAPSISIDYAVMERAERVAVTPVDAGWSDVGSWDALYELAELDADANAVTGDVVAIDSRGCLFRSDGPVVTAIGVEDLIVIATSDAVLVLPRGQSQRVKEVVEALQSGGRGELL